MEPSAARTRGDGLIQIRRPEHTYTVSGEPGDFSYSPGNREPIWVDDRLDHGIPRKGQAGRTTASFTAHLRDPGSADHATLPDICEEEGRPTSWWAVNTTSTLAGVSDLLTSDLIYTIDGSATGDPDWTLTFPDMYLTGEMSEGDPSSYSVSGEAAILAPVVT